MKRPERSTRVGEAPSSSPSTRSVAERVVRTLMRCRKRPLGHRSGGSERRSCTVNHAITEDVRTPVVMFRWLLGAMNVAGFAAIGKEVEASSRQSAVLGGF
jgi:hypothetical protein